MTGRLRDKVAIVTGAASGIGAETAVRLAAEGAATVVADINLAGAQQLVDRITAAGNVAAAVHVDLGEERSVAALIAFAVERFGGLDILDNNAADTRLSSMRDVGLEQTDVEVWDALMRINLRGTMLACRAAIPQMRARGGGSIINMSSGSGLTGALAPTAYGVSKAAIISLTQYVATQHGKEGIRCNAIAPGLIVTPATTSAYATGPFGEMMLRHHLTPRLGRPEDIASMVAFLASDESQFVTGQVIAVDGGLLAHAPYHADMVQMRSKA
ncbi:MAG: SDR family oxidoreductase [Sinobacteraceae bacterium]|nr:SDR family oxidoreductase [Nevskiaceae bacterium]